jgi:hypothetical protein
MVRNWFAIGGLLCLCTLTGCGGKRNSNIVLPSSFTLARFQPNYGGDLEAVNYWDKATVTYRFVDPANATDIRLNKLTAVNPTTEQKTAVRDAFAKWQAALATNDTAGRRTFTEVSATTNADIDVVTQTKDRFNAEGGKEAFGYTEFFVNNGVLQRAVMRLRNDLSSSEFRYNALHEEGHALGIDGHSRRLGTIMYAQELSIAFPSELTTYDKNTIGATYTR